ncbi:Nonribosomal peptide synthetases (NRPS) [Penicillium canescens]|nr:Nonribosomal peptide synthetases (NRPS) [Penicillium canescens]
MAIEHNEAAASSFAETAFSQFPPLPQDSHVSSPTKRLVLDSLKLDAPTIEDLDHILHLGWALVLASHTDSDQVLFGTAHHGRATDHGDQAIMPFRFKVQPDASVEESMAAVAGYQRELSKFEHLGLDKYSTKGLDYVVLCQFRNLLVVTGEQQPIPAPSYTQRYPLTVSCAYQNSHSVQIYVDFDPVILQPDMIRIMLTQFTDILTASIADPRAQIRGIQGIGAQGWKQLLEWNRAGQSADPVKIRGDHQIEERLKKTPNAKAVCTSDGTLTYEQLDHWASQIAQQLVDMGVKPGKFVGIVTPKSVVATVGMVAAMKAGGAFVLLPPSFPTFRLQTMCQKTPVHVILSNSTTLALAQELGLPVVGIHDDIRKGASAGLGNNFDPIPTEPHHPLYAIFTSGSTGEPKGALVSRGSYGSGIRGFCSRTGLGENTRVFQASPYAFVISIIEQLNALAVGACICIPSEYQLQNDFESTMANLNVSFGFLTPSLARTLNPRKITSLEILLLTGEPVKDEDVKKWMGHVTLYSLYGLSELSGSVLIKDLTGLPSSNQGLGYITNGACWIVDPDDHTQLRPIGMEGELLIESSTMATGYINNMEQTAATFVEQPKWLQEIRPSDEPGRCLKTGDLVRYQNLTGEIQLLRRKGRQTKIRGQRVELGEVESALLVHFPTAKLVVVDVLTSAAEKKSNPSWWHSSMTLPSMKSQKPQRLKRTRLLHRRARRATAELRKVLPSYMIPSSILPIRFIPRTVTGKISRKDMIESASRLSLTEILKYNEDQVLYRGPSTPSEQILQSVCEKLLRLPAESVSLDDNFFYVGGDSLTARRFSSMARAQGLIFSVAQVFEEATLASLARSSLLSTAQAEPGPHAAVVPKEDPFATIRGEFVNNLPSFLEASDIEDVWPTGEVQRMFLGHNLIEQYPWKIEGQLDKHKLRQACQSFIDRFPVFRSIFVPFRGKILQVTLRHVKAPLIELQAPEGEDLMAWIDSYAKGPEETKPLADQPMLKFTLVQGGPQEYAFLLRLSHAQYDGGCFKQISEELTADFNNQGGPVACPFSMYVRECDRLRTPEAFTFWKNQLNGAQITQLPRISDGEDTPVIHMGECSPATPPTGITVATAIKAAWSYVLAQKTGQSDVLFGQMGSCRGIDLPGAEDTLGMCLNTTPVRVRFEGIETVQGLFRAIQDQYVQSMEFNTIEWTDMLINSTNWPQDTQLDSVVLHENIPNIPGLEFPGGIQGRIGTPVFTTPAYKSHMLLTWPGNQKLTIMLMGRQNVLDKDFAETLVKNFGTTLVKFLDSPNVLLSSLEPMF